MYANKHAKGPQPGLAWLRRKPVSKRKRHSPQPRQELLRQKWYATHTPQTRATNGGIEAKRISQHTCHKRQLRIAELRQTPYPNAQTTDTSQDWRG